MRRLVAAMAVCAVMLLAFVVITSFMVMAVASGDEDAPASADCSSDTGPGGARPDLGPQWRTIVAAAISTGRDMGVPERGWIVNIAAGIQESRLTSLDHGDGPGPDSRGYLQQRNPWGPLEVRMDPAGAARLFYEHLLAVPGWEQMPITQAAQKVQGSAFPSAYAKWETLATELVAEVAGTPAASCAVAAVLVGGFSLPLPREAIHLPLGRHHDGEPFVDIPAAGGTAITAVRGGTVAYTTPGNACGLGMIITEADGTRWTYCHSSERIAANGATVATGEVVAKVGTTGHSDGNHLHLQVWAAGADHCPQPFLTALMAASGPDASVPSPASFPTTGPCV